MKKMRTKFLMATLVFATPLVSQAASFDCTKAKTEVEKYICADPSLSSLDEQISEAYRKLYASLDKRFKPPVLAYQRNWLRQRNRFVDLKATMTIRLDELQNSVVTVNSLTFLRVAGLQRPPYLMSQLPGSTDYNHWVDKVNNDAADDAAASAQFAQCDLEQEQTMKTLKPGDKNWDAAQQKLEQECEGLSGTDRTYTFDFASPDLLSVHESTSEFEWHAAHPNNTDTHYNWWLLKSGQIKKEDIFPGKGSTAIIHKRVKQTNGFDYSKSASAKAHIPDPSLTLSNWGLNGKGLIITGQGYDYEIGRGYVEINVPWEEFKGIVSPKLVEILSKAPPLTDARLTNITPQ